jgi:chromosome segregation ATPase
MAVAMQQVLQELSDLVPVVPARVSEVLDAGEALRERIAEARGRIEGLEPRCERMREELVAVLHEAREREQADGERVKELVGAYDGLRLELEKAAQDGRERIDKAGTAAREALADLQETVEAENHLSRYEERQLTSTRRHATMVAGYGRALEVAFQALRRRQEEMAGAVNDAHASVQAACETLAARIEDLQDDTAERLNHLEARTERAIELVGAKYEHAGPGMRDASELALEGLRHVLGGDGMVPDLMGLPALVQKVAEGAGLASAVAAAQAVAQHEARAMFGPLFEGVSVLLEPVDVALGAVRAAASLVGLGQD